MATVSANIHFDANEVGHKWMGGYGTLDIGKSDLHLYFSDAAAIDAVVTHLAELKTEMLAAHQPAPSGEGGVLVGPFDAGEGNRELGEPGRSLLAAAIAEQDAADEIGPARVGVPERIPLPASHYCDSGNCENCGDGRGDEYDDEVLPHCGARWPNRSYAGGSWICTLDKGHDGDHQATGGGEDNPVYSTAFQGDDEVTWDDETASVAE